MLRTMPIFLKSGGDPRRRTRARVAASISTLVLGAALGFAVTGPAAAASGPAQAGPHLLKPHKTGAAPWAGSRRRNREPPPMAWVLRIIR